MARLLLFVFVCMFVVFLSTAGNYVRADETRLYHLELLLAF